MQPIPVAGRFTKGYDTSQVEAFLGEVERSRLGHRPAVTAADIRRVGFTLVRGGYDVSTVDALLDELEERAVAVESGHTEPSAGSSAGSSSMERKVRGNLETALTAEPGSRLPITGRFRLGYAPAAVDAFLERLPDGLEEDSGLTVQDVRNVKFRARRGGYREEHVDDLLDHVVDLMLRRRVG